MGRLTPSAKGLSWFRTGHPWVFRNDLDTIQDAEPGSVVNLEKKNGEFLAQGFYSERSKIAFRLVSRNREKIDRDFWKSRLLAAENYRSGMVRETNAYRFIYAESDGIPSLIVDRYGEHAVMQALSQATEKLTPLFADLLGELFAPVSIILRNDVGVRELEGLPQEKKVLLGERPLDVEVYEGQVRYRVDLWNGQKTGAYLDQRENRRLSSLVLKGKVLDGFCYQGVFALHAASRASEVIGIDSSREAIEKAGENARLNGISNIDFRRENVFEFLKEAAGRGEMYDGIILDPPAFAKSRAAVTAAVRAYQELNLRALRILKPGGILITSSCSYNLSEARFQEILKDCARDAGSALRLFEKRGQGPDHPVLLTFPESYYLKCLFLEKAQV